MVSTLSSPRRLATTTAAALTLAGTLTAGFAGTASAASVVPRPPVEKSTHAVVATDTKARVTAAAWRIGRARHGVTVSAEQAIVDYWTPARMRAAKPIEGAPQLRKAATAYVKRIEKAGPTARIRALPSGPERSADPAVATSPIGANDLRPGSQPGPSILAAYNPNLPYYSPTARTMGKVFFTMGGVNYQCSGTIVNSEGKDTVWTAGHCVHGGQGGSWAYNWSFVPAYDGDLRNPRPYGTWTASQLWTKTAWTSSSDFSADMGVAIMNTNFGGWHIVDYLGGQGLRVNAGKNVFDYAFGYPAEAPFNGGNLYECWGTTTPEWDIWFVWSQTVKIPCDMTRGSSGGGWLNSYDGNWGYLNGVNSRIDRIVGPTIMLSPYFDDTAWSLYNDTRYR